MTIIVTGTPCTGKSTLAKKLAEKLKYVYVDGNAIAKEICSEYDDVRECVVVDTVKLNKKLITLIKKDSNVVIDSHLSHHLASKYVKLCIVCKCALKELKKRLEARGYSKQKVRENLDAEIFDVCLVEAQEDMGHKVLIVETGAGYKVSDILKRIESMIKVKEDIK